MSIADFHSHTNHSDGVLSPSKLISLAMNNQVAYLAITDHDTIDGIKEAKFFSKKNDDITIIPGIELSVDVLGEDVHILGIGIDEYNKALITELKKLKEARENRAREIIHMLSKKEIHLEMPKIKKKAGKATIGRPHIAQAMINKKYVSSVQEAFDNYWGEQKLAAFNKLCKDEKLNENKIQAIIEEYLFANQITSLNEKVDDALLERETLLIRKKTVKRVIEKIMSFIETFVDDLAA